MKLYISFLSFFFFASALFGSSSDEYEDQYYTQEQVTRRVGTPVPHMQIIQPRRRRVRTFRLSNHGRTLHTDEPSFLQSTISDKEFRSNLMKDLIHTAIISVSVSALEAFKQLPQFLRKACAKKKSSSKRRKHAHEEELDED